MRSVTFCPKKTCETSDEPQTSLVQGLGTSGHSSSRLTSDRTMRGGASAQGLGPHPSRTRGNQRLALTGDTPSATAMPCRNRPCHFANNARHVRRSSPSAGRESSGSILLFHAASRDIAGRDSRPALRRRLRHACRARCSWSRRARRGTPTPARCRGLPAVAPITEFVRGEPAALTGHLTEAAL
jgi:hypothetical protein